MNIKNYLKRALYVLICLALIASSVEIIIPKCYAEDQKEAAVEQQTSATGSTTGESAESTSGTGDTQSDIGQESSSDSKSSSTKKSNEGSKKIVSFAKKQLGKPYRYGGYGPNSFDCIGFVYYVFAKSGVKLKTSMTKKKSYNLKKNFSKYIVSHSLKDAKAGDIIAYYSGSKTKHAAVAIGNGKCISARTKGGIKTNKLKGRSGCKVAVIRIVK